MRSLLMRVALGAAACILSATSAARAGTAAMSFSSWTYYANYGEFSLGEDFTVDQAIQITALGYLDTGSADHQVGIYNLSQNLLVSATVNPSADPLVGFFYYQTLATPLTLPAGHYVLAATNGPEAYTYVGAGANYVTDFQTAPGFSFFNDRFTSSSTLVFPAVQHEYDPFAWFGANFQFTSVPEPSTISLALTGALGMLGCAWLKRHKTAARSKEV